MVPLFKRAKSEYQVTILKKKHSRVPKRCYLLGPRSYYSIMFFKITFTLRFQSFFHFPWASRRCHVIRFDGRLAL